MSSAGNDKRNIPPASRLGIPMLALSGASGELSPRLPPDKTLGEFIELPTNYEGSYRPARMGLRRALESGKMRNPLQMNQSNANWSGRRPLSASSTSRPSSRNGRPCATIPVTSSARARPWDLDDKVAVGTNVAGKQQPADRGPGMLQPQRIELPSYLNTPARRPEGEPPLPEERTSAVRRIQDLELLTFACRRASKLREEGRAHFSLGVLRDNLGQYLKAIESYNQFLRVCKTCNDGQGTALAYHCIGVDYQLLGSGLAVSPEGASAGAPGTEKPAPTTAPAVDEQGSEIQAPTAGVLKPELLRKCIFYHNRHRENSDSVGKFVAHLNMGLAYALLCEKEASTVNHQYALRYALQLRSLEGQSLAIGSLSFSAGIYDNDPEKMKVLIERYVELCNTLKQPKNQGAALKKLGVLAAQQGNNEESIEYFQKAIACAREQGDRQAEKDCSVRLGIAAGQAKMNEHLSAILKKSVVGGIYAESQG
eukprot:TRINITY_DN95059_c0_g1_i1.p1 TRINITY_DN95059_c0_g1~~TRINITY_DN95059_c0_g1_i1.p1  ORF type:complete len:482 (+),score=72.48 TRINITY_DN95059_c0_g1_i1:110-1555(+)